MSDRSGRPRRGITPDPLPDGESGEVQEGEHPLALFDSLSAEELTNVLGAVNYSENLYAAFERSVEDQNLLEALDTKKPKASQFGKAKPWIPTHFWLSRKKRYCLVG